MVQVGSGNNQLSQELLQAARAAASGDRKIQGKEEIDALAKAALKDGQVTEGEQQFLNALADGTNMEAFLASDFDPNQMNFDTISKRPQGALSVSVNQAVAHQQAQATSDNLRVSKIEEAVFNKIPARIREEYGITRESVAQWKQTGVPPELAERMASDMSLGKQQMYEPVKLVTQLGRAINTQRQNSGQVSAADTQTANAAFDRADRTVGQKWETYHAQADRELHGNADAAMAELKAAQAENPPNQEKITAATLKANQANNEALKFNDTMIGVRTTQMNELGATDQRRNQAADQLYKGAKLQSHTGQIEDTLDGSDRSSHGLPERYIRSQELLAAGDAIYAGEPTLNTQRLQAQEALVEGVTPYAHDALNRREDQLGDAEMGVDMADELDDTEMQDLEDNLAIPEQDQQIFKTYQAGSSGLRESYQAQIDDLEAKPDRTADEEQRLQELRDKQATHETSATELADRATALGEYESSIRDKAETKHGVYLENEQARQQAEAREKQLYPNGLDSIRAVNVKQGATGDCYFLAAVAGMADTAEGREAIKKMITANEDGTYTVTFPGQDPVTVEAPTDEEKRKYAKTGGNGDWLAVLEKGYTELERQNNWVFNYDDRYDEIGLIGAPPSVGIALMTGHATDTDFLPTASDETTHQKMDEALKNGRLVSASIRNNMPWAEGETDTGLPMGHVYTVTGYNPETREVTFRNPWGKSGGVGDIDNDGVATMPLSEFTRTFTLVAYEQPE